MGDDEVSQVRFVAPVAMEQRGWRQGTMSYATRWRGKSTTWRWRNAIARTKSRWNLGWFHCPGGRTRIKD